MEFLKIPSNLIMDKKYKSNLLSIIIYLSCCENKLNVCRFSFSEFIEYALWSKPKYGKNSIVSEAKEFINYISDDEYFEVVGKLRNITLTTNITGKLNLKYELDSNGNPIKWFKLYIEDYKKILDLKGKLDKKKLLNLYCYILSRIIRRNDNINNINITGGNAEVFWCSQEEICNNLNITRQTLNTYLKKLNELNLVCYDNIGKLVKDNTIITPHNVYATNEQELKEGLKQSKYYWENQGWKVINKKS